MQTSSYRIALILVTFNRCKMLQENLHSLKQQGNLTYFIIDNNSSDATRETVEAFRKNLGADLYYYNTGENLGGAGGFALGCQKALEHPEHFTHFWLTDDDVAFEADCLSNLLPHLDSRTILQPMRYAPDGKNEEASAINIDLSSICILNHKRNAVKDTPFATASEPFAIQNIPFEGPMIPRAVFETVGLPDDRYFIFGDDLDFSIKSLKKGFAIHCVPEAKMIRQRPGKIPRSPSDWKSYFVYRNFFHIQRTFGTNPFVRNRPYLLAILLTGYCLVTGNFKGIRIIHDALTDGLSDNFDLNSKYIPE